MADTLQFTTTAVTLSSGVSTLLVPRSASRQYLAIQNTGVNPVTLGFVPLSSQSSLAVGQSISLDPSIISGGLQGGVWEFINTVPSNSIYGISANGTTVVLVTA